MNTFQPISMEKGRAGPWSLLHPSLRPKYGSEGPVYMKKGKRESIEQFSTCLDKENLRMSSPNTSQHISVDKVKSVSSKHFS